MWKKAAKQMGSQLQMTSGNHPEANGQAEQMNRVVQHLLRHYMKPSEDDWDEKLPLIASLYNNAVHSTTGVSPNQLHLGWKPRSALDFLLPKNRPAATPGTIEFGVQYEKLLQQTVEHIKKSQEAMIASENKRRRQSTFQVGEHVWVKASELGQEFGISRKLTPQYFGPWEVLDIVGNDLDGPSYVPDAIKGDFDSIRPEVKDYYAKLGTEIIDVSYDQDTTDLHKCISFVVESTPMVEQRKLVVLGALGGRLDHELANFHLLHEFANLRIILLNDENLALLLPGRVRNVIKPNTAWQGPHCGLIPIGFPSMCTTTTGLQWNLDGTGMAFGKLVSSSNRLNSDVITVVSDTSLLWTTEIRTPRREEHHCLLLLSRRAGKSMQNGRVHSL
ncbi:hypothetical protein CBR_g34735 [Chara braunii]|uniref:thiamine diphosphokinase n=1 Tax=Chara braunii TaxID=69332 RepID=A0A388JZ28_CHABU|nr:hypothetical protein CBR_g34735 [Chara braunii]|eukprot:GBG63036.1 hypothetical protein CBR_g34735 [Chara braunii]